MEDLDNDRQEQEVYGLLGFIRAFYWLNKAFRLHYEEKFTAAKGFYRMASQFDWSAAKSFRHIGAVIDLNLGLIARAENDHEEAEKFFARARAKGLKCKESAIPGNGPFVADRMEGG